MKTDRQIKNIADRLNAISNSSSDALEGNTNSNGNGHNDNNNDNNNDNKRDDDYYLNMNRDPPRFLYYRQARAEKEEAHAVTMDELDYALKRRLRMIPESRYQHEKRHWYWHESAYPMRRLETYDGYGCYNGECIPSCRFYPEFGVIEDEEIIEDHSNLVEY